MVAGPLRPLRFARRLVWLGVLVLVGVAAWTADTAARAWAERRAGDEIAGLVPEAESVSVDLGGFPFLWHAVRGEVTEGHVTLDRLTVAGIVVTAVELDARDVRLDWWEGRLRDVGAATVSVHLGDAEVEAATGVTVRLLPGSIAIVTPDGDIPAGIAIVDDALVITPVGAPALTVALPGADLAPCAERAITVELGEVVVTCEVAGLPSGYLL